ncbi:MAG TPA: insulinase family protein [Kofleriaceae bacterium]|nr:insulinase family protein [Kofleriaceae bacterium]
MVGALARRIGPWLAGIALCCACAVVPRPPPAPPARTRLGLAISSTTLANGLRVIVVKDPTAAGVQVTARYQVGSVDDQQHPGMAHLIEHLMFQQVLDGQPVFAQLEDVATSFNAVTTLDATTYVARAPGAALDKLLAIETARLELRCRTITDLAFAHEREVVLNEVKQRDQATEVFAALHGALYPEGHPYRQAVGGTVKTVSAITREQACRFADAYYAPDNVVLVISGNLAERQLAAALEGLGARIARRTAAAPAPIPSATVRPQHVEVRAPIDDDLLVLAWPLPLEPDLQARVRAIGAALPNLVDGEIKGQVEAVEFGDRRAPMLGLAVLPGEGETFQQAIDGTRRGIAKLPRVFRASGPENADEIVFDRVQQSAIYHVYASLEDGSERDVRLAGYLLSGRDPGAALAAELRGLRGMSREDGSSLAARYLDAATPTMVTLRASPGKKRGDGLKLRAPIHDLGPRRTSPDPARAHRPADATIARELAGMTTRVLRNGLHVVLLPLTNVPTFEARLVFRSGTASEPADQRGVALLAAHTLTWDLHYLNDLFPFARAGGMRDTDVGTDRTSFSVQGLDMHLDVVLAGLRRWVWDGTYDDSAASYVNAMRHAAKRERDQGALTDAWRAALFGQRHPYVQAGIIRHANSALTLDDAERFREAHYTPDNATLVIAGRFDPALADRWIDYLFAGWRGHAEPSPSVPPAPQPASIASVEDVAMLQLRIALPVGGAGRPQQLIAAAMLNEIAHDVRYRLGASYAFDAQLAETRLASYYVMSGWIDAPRAAAAVKLVRDRIQELRTDPRAAAPAFVTARDHALTQLRSHVGSARSLADRVERDVEMARDPMSDVRTAGAVQAVTLDDMTATLAELDLARAAVLMNGPAAELKAAFDVLGRQPVYLQAAGPRLDREPAPAAAPAAFASAEQRVRVSELQASLTEQPPFPQRLLVIFPGVSRVTTAVPGGLAGTVTLSGASLGAGVGYRYGWFTAFGAYLGLGMFDGNDAYAPAGMQAVRLVPLDVLGLAHIDSRGRYWGDVMLGLHLDRISATTTEMRWSALYGLQAGVDIARFGTHRIGIGVRWTTARAADTYSSLSLGLVYRQ